jgi:hypothetical protein
MSTQNFDQSSAVAEWLWQVSLGCQIGWIGRIALRESRSKGKKQSSSKQHSGRLIPSHDIHIDQDICGVMQVVSVIELHSDSFLIGHSSK